MESPATPPVLYASAADVTLDVTFSAVVALPVAGVKAFQKAESVAPISGYFGPVTRGVANTILANQLGNNSEGNATTTQVPVDFSQQTNQATTTYTPPSPINHLCPSGYSGTYPNCVAPQCPQYYSGTYPNCVALQCPSGTTGTYPYCTNTSTPPTTNTSNTATPVTQTNSSSVTILADGSSGPINVPLNSGAVTISWTSNNVLACGISGPSGSGSVATDGHAAIKFSATSTVSIQCSALVNNVVTENAVSDSVTINIGAPTPPPPQCQLGGTYPNCNVLGTLTVSTDPSSPPYSLAAGGTSGLTLAVLRMQASNEPVNLQKIGLTLTSGSTTDITHVYVYEGNNGIGTFLGSAPVNGTNITVSLSGAGQISDVTPSIITIRADIPPVGTNQATEGDLVQLNYLSVQGWGALTGETINGSALNGSGTAGIRIQ